MPSRGCLGWVARRGREFFSGRLMTRRAVVALWADLKKTPDPVATFHPTALPFSPLPTGGEGPGVRGPFDSATHQVFAHSNAFARWSGVSVSSRVMWSRQRRMATLGRPWLLSNISNMKNEPQDGQECPSYDSKFQPAACQAGSIQRCHCERGRPACCGLRPRYWMTRCRCSASRTMRS